MKTIIQLQDLQNIFEYEKDRDDVRREIIQYKKNRRIALGPYILITFENFRTLHFQIQEMMRTERMVSDKQIQEECNVYNSIMPSGSDLSATLFIEITSEQDIRTVLNEFIGMTEGQHLWFGMGKEKIYAHFEAGREEDDKISSVHYIRFPFLSGQIKSFQEAENACLEISFKEYQFRTELSPQVLTSLRADLEI
jgi:hypothetical protein